MALAATTGGADQQEAWSARKTRKGTRKAFFQFIQMPPEPRAYGPKRLILMSLSLPVCIRYGRLPDAITNKPQTSMAQHSKSSYFLCRQNLLGIQRVDSVGPSPNNSRIHLLPFRASAGISKERELTSLA